MRDGRVSKRKFHQHRPRQVGQAFARRGIAPHYRIPAPHKKITFDLHSKLFGHAICSTAEASEIVDDGILLIGDAAGMAYSQSGEGIRPAIENPASSSQSNHRSPPPVPPRKSRSLPHITHPPAPSRPHDDRSVQIGRRRPPRLMSSLGCALLATKWFSRHIVLNTWFLRTNEPALQ